MLYKSIVIVIIFYSNIAFSASTAKNTKNCSVDEVDICAQNVYVYGNKTFQFPHTRDSTKNLCKSMKVAEQCVRDYGRQCLKPFGRQYLSIMMKGPSNILKKICSDKGIEEFLSHKQCMNASKLFLDECQTTTIEDMLKVKLAKRQEWISLICCYLNKLDRCSDSVIQSNCEGSSISYLKNILSGYQGEINDLVCNQGLRWGSKTCNTLTRNLGAIDAKAKRPMSVIPIILDLMNRIINKN